MVTEEVQRKCELGLNYATQQTAPSYAGPSI